MAEMTPTETDAGISRVDDIRIETVTFVAVGDFAFISTNGYDYVSFLPIGPDGTEPTASGVVTFKVYGWDKSTGTLVAASQALIAAEAGRHLAATVTATARTAGYLAFPPKNITIEMAQTVAGGTPANLVLRVELRKRRAVATVVGRG